MRSNRCLPSSVSLICPAIKSRIGDASELACPLTPAPVGNHGPILPVRSTRRAQKNNDVPAPKPISVTSVCGYAYSPNLVASASSAVLPYQISVRCKSAVLTPCGICHLTLIANTNDSVVSAATVGGKVVLPLSTVSMDSLYSEPISSALIARTLAT